MCVPTEKALVLSDRSAILTTSDSLTLWFEDPGIIQLLQCPGDAACGPATCHTDGPSLESCWPLCHEVGHSPTLGDPHPTEFSCSLHFPSTTCGVKSLSLQMVIFCLRNHHYYYFETLSFHGVFLISFCVFTKKGDTGLCPRQTVPSPVGEILLRVSQGQPLDPRHWAKFSPPTWALHPSLRPSSPTRGPAKLLLNSDKPLSVSLSGALSLWSLP